MLLTVTTQSINPSQPEVCNDIDDNCDGQTDNNAVNSATGFSMKIAMAMVPVRP